jgi:hypothetical protein
LSDSFWSLSAENGWVCDKAEYGSNILMAQSIGIIINTLLFLQPSDSWGRLKVLQIVNLTYLISRFVMLFVYNNYIGLMVVTALGSGFYPVGVRNGYALGRFFMSYMFLHR